MYAAVPNAASTGLIEEDHTAQCRAAIAEFARAPSCPDLSAQVAILLVEPDERRS